MMKARNAAIALCLLCLAPARLFALPLYSEVAQKAAPYGCVVSGGNVSAIAQAHYMLISLSSGEKERFAKAASCMREKLSGGEMGALPAALWGPDPDDGGKEKILDGSKPTEAAVLEAWCLIEAGKAFGGDYAKQGEALLGRIKEGAFPEGPLGMLLPPEIPRKEGDLYEVAPASLPPFALARFCAIDQDFCRIRADSLRAVVRGAGQGYVPDRISFTKEGLLAIRPDTQGSDEASRFWHYVALTNPGDPDRALLLSALGRLRLRLDAMLRPPKREFMHPRTEEGMGSAQQDAAAASAGSLKSRWFLGAASSATLMEEEDPLGAMIMLESLWLQDRRLGTSLQGGLLEDPSK